MFKYIAIILLNIIIMQITNIICIFISDDIKILVAYIIGGSSLFICTRLFYILNEEEKKFIK